MKRRNGQTLCSSSDISLLLLTADAVVAVQLNDLSTRFQPPDCASAARVESGLTGLRRRGMMWAPPGQRAVRGVQPAANSQHRTGEGKEDGHADRRIAQTVAPPCGAQTGTPRRGWRGPPRAHPAGVLEGRRAGVRRRGGRGLRPRGRDSRRAPRPLDRAGNGRDLDGEPQRGVQALLGRHPPAAVEGALRAGDGGADLAGLGGAGDEADHGQRGRFHAPALPHGGLVRAQRGGQRAGPGPGRPRAPVGPAPGLLRRLVEHRGLAGQVLGPPPAHRQPGVVLSQGPGGRGGAAHQRRLDVGAAGHPGPPGHAGRCAARRAPGGLPGGRQHPRVAGDALRRRGAPDPRGAAGLPGGRGAVGPAAADRPAHRRAASGAGAAGAPPRGRPTSPRAAR